MTEYDKKGEAMKQYYRQGEVEFKKARGIKGKKLNHLVIAYGETTGHKHEVIGDAELYEENGVLYLLAKNEVEVVHPDHKTIKLPQGDYEIEIQKEYVVGDEQYAKVRD